MMILFITEKAKKKLTQVKLRHISAAQVGLPEFDCVTIRNWKCVCRPVEAVGLDNEGRCSTPLHSRSSAESPPRLFILPICGNQQRLMRLLSQGSASTSYVRA
jgi:hypothetical protein